MTVHRGRWSLADRVEGIMRELPVDVPPGTAELTVELQYAAGVGVLDLGCAGPGGFRGWSGGARRRFTISADWATPGYLTGELEPGRWHVLLRLHRIPPDGLDYEVTATVADRAPSRPDPPVAPPVPPRPPRRAIPDVDGRRWLAGDLHSHTLHSDGVSTVAELAALAAGRGLDFLAVTDHNTISHHAELPSAGAAYAIALLPGQEVTTDRGHANALGSISWVDFREPAAEWVRAVERDGGLLSINHPLGGDCAWRQPLPVRPRLAEVWHSGWFDRTWGAPMAWAQAWRPDTVPVGGSDYHRPGHDGLPGSPTTWVLTDPAAEPERGLLDGLRSGQVAVSAGPGEPVLLRIGDELLALDADGTLLTAPDGSQRVVRGDRVRLPASQSGLHLLETYRMEVVALCL